MIPIVGVHRVFILNAIRPMVAQALTTDPFARTAGVSAGAGWEVLGLGAGHVEVKISYPQKKWLK